MDGQRVKEKPGSGGPMCSRGDMTSGEDGASTRTAAESIAEHIRSRIASGELQPGDMLPSERVLLESYDVARPTMRETLRILESDGLITIERGTRGGARVVVPDLNRLARRVGLLLQLRGTDLKELIEAQAAIQPGAAALAAHSSDRAEFERLRAAVDRCVEATSIEVLLTSLEAFSRGLMEASHNRPLVLYNELIASLLTKALRDYAEDAGISVAEAAGALRWATKQLATLVDLIEAGEAERAAQFWRETLGRVAVAVWPDPSPFAVYPRPS
jgi:GntR family transcriptional repressor for pyruvate dehydrogenase complex